MKTLPWYRHKTPRTGSEEGSHRQGQAGEDEMRMRLCSLCSTFRNAPWGGASAEREPEALRGWPEPPSSQGDVWGPKAPAGSQPSAECAPSSQFPCPWLGGQFCLCVGGRGSQGTEIRKHSGSAQHLRWVLKDLRVWPVSKQLPTRF